MAFQQFIAQLKDRLSGPLPGMEAQFEMAHVNRLRAGYDGIDTGTYRPSAVLILLYPVEVIDSSILLIERPTYKGHHSGQIALPGGKAEASDESLEQTALREFFEETGSDTTPVMLGKLTPVIIPVSSFVVHPFVAYADVKPAFSPDSREIANLLELRVSHLLDPAIVKETVLEPSPSMKIKTPYFDVQGKILWGATAMILNELKHLLKS
ncbi:MAG: CoA pyrophosphatase [Bacteroidetes bacterium]|nr:CoA pyrophosphatase [Bacteroidota bacterium]